MTQPAAGPRTAVDALVRVVADLNGLDDGATSLSDNEWAMDVVIRMRDKGYEIVPTFDAWQQGYTDAWNRLHEPDALARLCAEAASGLREALERIVKEHDKGYETSEDLGDAIDNARSLLAGAPYLTHPRTYSLTASGPNGELFLVTDDESGIQIGHAKLIGGPLTAPAGRGGR